MSLRVIEPLGVRDFDAADLPLKLGGAGADLLLPGAAAGSVAALVDLRDGQVVVEDPRTGRVQALVSGDQLEVGSAMLALREEEGLPCLTLAHDALDRTLPPEGAGAEAAEETEAPERVPVQVLPYQPPQAERLKVRGILPWTRMAAGAGALVVLALLGVLLASVAVSVRTTPAVAGIDVEFRGTWLDIGLGGRYLVLPGQYTVEVRAEGYAPASVEAEVRRGPDQVVMVPLERLPGRLEVETGGVRARLVVDGRLAGELPGTLEVAAGTREVLVEADRYLPHRETVDILGGGETQQLIVALTPSFAPVRIESAPAGAQVIIDGQALGTTPLETELDAGRHELRLAYSGYRDFTSPFTVRGGEPLTVGPIELGRPDATLRVSTEPAGADVSVAGRYRGKSPLVLTLSPGIEQEVTLSRQGYASAERSVRLGSGEQARLAVRLEPVLGEIRLRGQPEDAELLVDGQPRGAANQVLQLPTAPHRIEVRKAGFASFETTVTPTSGLAQTVEFKLTTPEEARAARLPASVKTGLGQELRLVRGGKFVMGSPRREPGRRSNEAERTVELKRPFYLGVREVSNAEFRAFRAEHASGIHREESLDLDRQPAVRVGWQDAAAFCNWLSARDGLPPAYVAKNGRLELAQPVTTGYRLPTEAEWEYAARFDGRGATRKYPWGDALPVAARSGNYADQSAIYLTAVVISGYEDGYRVSAPVGSYPANPLGIQDLGGNVQEWTNDRYSIYVTDASSSFVDPVGPEAGEAWVVRGAGWLTGRTPELRLAWRDGAAVGRQDLGFRIARYAE
ncbi:MAG: PEGA domain-containing protein [Steroidobacteraceae bacterium]